MNECGKLIAHLPGIGELVAVGRALTTKETRSRRGVAGHVSLGEQVRDLAVRRLIAFKFGGGDAT
ncbi:hypothetical protein D3C71_768340 [compost metagenome]